MTKPASRQRKIIHIDMDAFFASVEQRDNPQYRGKPLIVGGSPRSRGVVAACSYEARVFGIHSAMPSAHAVRCCPQALFVRPRIDRYREVSQEIMGIFHNITNLVEPLSLDEAFLDVTENSWGECSATRLAEIIRKEIYTATGLTASAGVSCNKFIAKVASDINKPDGLTLIPPEQAEAFVASLPIGKFYGVGKATKKKMLALGIKTGASLRQWTLPDLTFHFGKSGQFFYNISRGLDERPVQPGQMRKSTGRETTLSEDIDDILEIQTILKELAREVGESLCTLHERGFTLTLKVRFQDFTTITRSHTSQIPITSDFDIYTLLPNLLTQVEFYGKKIRLLGVSVGKLTRNDEPHQLLLPFMKKGYLEITSSEKKI
ncbi:DNA polymerase IV [Desulforhopalus vacuolatus]|uniref:DNA polymerase IV n=1 Tax=Desulforhopalus vacuolatus TaxID=40414 RepID=UPI001963EB74|nr:DNA polymerase IV [Desulforhopalus vacuolatus]MBM9520713.1 DNA polymerase IV [Desulforhopalus vacuolatus]